MGQSCFEYGFEFAEKIKIIAGNVWLRRSNKDRGSNFRGLIETAESLKKISTTLFIHRKVVFCTKLCLKKSQMMLKVFSN
jgi:hypothetical protein